MERLTSWNEDCVLINGHALGYATKCELVQMAERLAAYEDSRLSPQACAQAAEIEKQLASYDFSAKKMLEFIGADKAGRCVVLPPEEKALDSSVEYTEICALYHFCIDLGIKCTIERLYDGYAVRFPDGSDFAQHHGTYGGTEGCVEPAIGDTEFDYSAIGLNLAKELVKKYKDKLEDRKEAEHA